MSVIKTFEERVAYAKRKASFFGYFADHKLAGLTTVLGVAGLVGFTMEMTTLALIAPQTLAVGAAAYYIGKAWTTSKENSLYAKEPSKYSATLKAVAGASLLLGAVVTTALTGGTGLVASSVLAGIGMGFLGSASATRNTILEHHGKFQQFKVRLNDNKSSKLDTLYLAKYAVFYMTDEEKAEVERKKAESIERNLRLQSEEVQEVARMEKETGQELSPEEFSRQVGIKRMENDIATKDLKTDIDLGDLDPNKTGENVLRANHIQKAIGEIAEKPIKPVLEVDLEGYKALKSALVGQTAKKDAPAENIVNETPEPIEKEMEIGGNDFASRLEEINRKRAELEAKRKNIPKVGL